MTFQPGKSGNPSGMSKQLGKTLRLARKLSPKAMLLAGKMMEGAEREADRIKCMELVLKVAGAMRIGEATLGITPEQLQSGNLEELRETLNRFLEQATKPAAQH